MKPEWRALVSICALTLLSTLAHAGDNAAAADQLYKEARALAKKGDHANACPKFEASYKLERALGTLLNLADCHENVGKVASAWAEWNEAIDMARQAKDGKRQKFATERRDKIEPKLPKLTVTVKNRVAGLSVYRDDALLDEAAYDVALAIDPGEHTISVRRQDKILKSEPVTTKVGETSSVSFDLAAIDAASPATEPPPPAPTTTAPPPPPTATATTPPPAAPPPSSSQKTIGYVVGGAGVVALLVAGGLEIAALSKKSKADEPDQCVNNYCSPNGFKTIDDAKQLATIGQWVGVGGVLLTAVGFTLVVTSPSTEAPRTGRRPQRLHAGGWLSPAGGGLSVGGAL